VIKNSCPERHAIFVDEAISKFKGKHYHKMQEWVKQKYRVSVKTCWIADRKRKLGYDVKKATNAKW
jgi:hypothetical protein